MARTARSRFRGRDLLFVRFAGGLFVLLIFYGAAMTIVLIVGEQAVGLRMLTGFSSMFTGVLGLGTGYLLGTAAGAGDKK